MHQDGSQLLEKRIPSPKADWLSQIKEEPIYNPQKPSEDYKDMYFWSAYDAYRNTSYLGTWQAIHSQRNGWSTCNMEIMDNTRTHFYARKSKK